MKKNGLTLRSFLLGALFSGVFAAVTIYADSRLNICMTSTQLPVLPYLLLIVMVVLLNPLFRLVRIVRAFSSVELMIVFTMGMVSASLSTFGLIPPLVSIAGGLFNSDWNSQQSEWNRYVVPYLNERYFVSSPGIQAEAVKYKRALDVALDKKAVYEAARLVASQGDMAAALASELGKSPGKDSSWIEKTRVSLTLARRLHEEALLKWRDVRRRNPGLPDWQEALRQLPSDIEKEERLADEAEKKLVALEGMAFERVAVFRRGLPRDERAFPGIWPLAGDDSRAYFGRLRRLTGGMGTLRRMKETRDSLRSLPADRKIGPELAGAYRDLFARSAKELMALCHDADLSLLKQRLDAEDKAFIEKRMDLTSQLKSVSGEKRGADRRRALELAGQSDRIIGEMEGFDRRYKRFKQELERYHLEMDCVGKIRALATGIDGLRDRLAGGNLRVGELAGAVTSLLPGFASMDVSLRRYFIGQIPWGCWVKPLSHWALLIGLTYIVLMSLNVLIFRQWAHNERLTYPLAELPRALMGEVDSAGLPPLFRNGLFWAGAAISGSVLGWNLFCSTQIVPGLAPLDLLNRWGAYVAVTSFAALGSVRSEIFFTMIGLSFLVPKNISFSLWFFYVVYMVQLLLMVWTGQGQNAGSFPWDWWYQSNFQNAQGQGALIVFSGCILYKCRKYILCAFFPSSVAELDESERNELKLSSLTFLGCSLGLILILWLSMGANLCYTVLFYAIILVVTIGLIRVVAEGGLLGFQAWANPIHLVRNFFGLDRSWTSASLFAPLMLYYSVIFLDIKTFIAPAMANALKLREDYGLKRWSFHVAVLSAILVAAVVAVVAALLIAYNSGADSMNGWFYSSWPRECTFNVIRSAVKDMPLATTENVSWTLGGGLAMAGLLFFRQIFFWMPHPFGLIMFVNPSMAAYWFPIFVGWICNVAVTKYGNKDSFLRARGFFIGLIVGELILIAMSFVVTMALGTQSGIDLNR